MSTCHANTCCLERDGHAADGDEGALVVAVSHRTILLVAQATHKGVVLAADGLGGAGRAAADTDDADGGAVEAEQDIEVLNHDADRSEGGSARGRSSLSRSSVTSPLRHIERKVHVQWRLSRSTGSDQWSSRGWKRERRWGWGWRPQGRRRRGRWRWRAWRTSLLAGFAGSG